MVKLFAVSAALAISGSAPLSAQEAGPRLGLHLGSAYGVSVSQDEQPTFYLGRQNGTIRESYRREEAVPSVELTLDVPVGRRTEVGVEAGYLPIQSTTRGEAVISHRFLTLTPTIGLRLSGSRVQPRLYGGPTLLHNVLRGEISSASGDQTALYTTVGTGYGASVGAGLALLAGRGAFRDVRFDVEGTYARLASDITHRSVGVRVGVGLSPPKARAGRPRPRPDRG